MLLSSELPLACSDPVAKDHPGGPQNICRGHEGAGGITLRVGSRILLPESAAMGPPSARRPGQGSQGAQFLLLPWAQRINTPSACALAS